MNKEIKVTGCIDCPFKWYDKEIMETLCLHPNKMDNIYQNIKEPDKDCPLKQQAIIITL
jgi:hypothetical protein